MITSYWVGILISVILGLIIGSFLNVIILRFDDLKSVISTRSRCPHCKKEIAWYDLLPLFSFVFLRGECRNCKAKISYQYPLVELGTALIFGLIFWKFGLSLELAFLIPISAILVVIFVYDILYYLISDFLVYLAICFWIIFLALSYFIFHNSLSTVLHSLYGGLAFGGFLALLVIISKEKWMGAGDIMLGFLLGLLISWPNVLVGLFMAFLLGSIIGLILIGSHKKKVKDNIPFAPFMIMGMLIALFFGQLIIDWYMGGIWS